MHLPQLAASGQQLRFGTDEPDFLPLHCRAWDVRFVYRDIILALKKHAGGMIFGSFLPRVLRDGGRCLVKNKSVVVLDLDFTTCRIACAAARETVLARRGRRGKVAQNGLPCRCR